MREKPSGVTKFGCGEIGRSGKSSNASPPSGSLTNALLMKRQILRSAQVPPAAAPCPASFARGTSGAGSDRRRVSVQEGPALMPIRVARLLRARRVEAADLLGRELERAGAEIVPQLLGIARTKDDAGHRRPRQEPCKRDLRDRTTGLGRQRFEHVGDS